MQCDINQPIYWLAQLSYERRYELMNNLRSYGTPHAIYDLLCLSFVYTTLYCATGKVSTGEYYCDFKHIDGDFTNGSSESSWKSYVQDLADQALQEASHSENIIISSRHQRLPSQEFLVKTLIEGGASEENITVVRLSDDTSTTTKRKSSIHQSPGAYSTQYCTWHPKKIVGQECVEWVVTNEQTDHSFASKKDPIINVIPTYEHTVHRTYD